MSSFRSISPSIKGEEWSGELYFDPDASDKSENRTGHYITHDSLRTKLKQLVGGDEKINYVYIYKTPLFKKQLTHAILYHAYVVMETDTHFWSLEKNSKELILQRSETLEHVRDYCQGKKRNLLVSQSEPILWKYKEKRTSLLQLFGYLWWKDDLNRAYNWLASNCQKFATRIFDYFSEPNDTISTAGSLQRRPFYSCMLMPFWW
uniref:Uncharacterized protein n=1 Tax=Clytia hemisphaerica TaxID=252671 RepID=A0A7M5XNX6_9CNID